MNSLTLENVTYRMFWAVWAALLFFFVAWPHLEVAYPSFSVKPNDQVLPEGNKGEKL